MSEFLEFIRRKLKNMMEIFLNKSTRPSKMYQALHHIICEKLVTIR